MGKATIVSGGDDGKYSVNLDFGTKVRDAHLQRITTRLAKLQTETAEAQTKLDAQKVIETSKRAAVETAIAEFVAASNTVPRVEANVSKALKAHSDAAKELMKQKGATAKLRLALEMLQDQTAQLKKDDAYWRGLALEETRQVWCADLTEEGEGEVATIEIPGESKLILIAPEAREAKPEDGQLVAREVQTAAQVFFNAAILPGWQKWKPTYRTGRITALDLEGNTADVDLDDEKSSAQKLDVNQGQALQKVPVIYMGCHAEAFEVGDACVVEFKNAKWESPQVVGFVSNPKACPGGIGIEVGGKMLILRPSASGGQWNKSTVQQLNGGVAYAVVGSTSFVESGGGLCRSNKQVTGPLHSAGSIPQIGANSSFNTSGLFISHGAVKQLKISGDSLLLKGRTIKDLPGGIEQSGSYALPSVADTNNWEMVSATPKGTKFTVCRMKSEDTEPGGFAQSYVKAVAHFAGNDADVGAIEFKSLQNFAQDVVIRDPAGPGSKAPQFGRFTTQKSFENSVSVIVLNNMVNNYEADLIKYLSYKQYNEDSDFDARSVYRAYLGHDGALVVDEAKHINKAKIETIDEDRADGYQGFQTNYQRRDHIVTSIDVERSEELLFGGVQNVKTYETIIKYSYDVDSFGTAYSAYTYLDEFGFPAITGSATTGYWKNVSAEFSRTAESIVLVDDQFSVVITVKAGVAYDYLLSGGIQTISLPISDNAPGWEHVFDNALNRGEAPSPPFTYVPETESSSLAPVQATLEILQNGGRTSTNLDSSGFSSAGVKDVLDNAVRKMKSPREEREEQVVNDDGQGNSSGFVKNQLPFEAYFRGLTDQFISANLGEIKYAKDPKTGHGFLSFSWAGETMNYVIGPWGALPSTAKTDVPANAYVSRLNSI